MCEGIVAKKGLNNSRVMVFMSQNYRKSHLIDLQYDGNKKAVIRDTLKHTMKLHILQQKDLQRF